ncbi:MAG: OmpW family outer membrane protein [Rhizomicrobium sp.]
MRMSLSLAAALLVCTAAISPALADDDDLGVAGHFQVRLRGLAVIPDASAKVTVGGTPLASRTDVTDSFIPEVDGTYFITDHIGVELIAGTTKHSVHNSVAGNVGSVWLLPPTLTVQYHFDPTGSIRPYVGAGVNYTFFYSAHSAAYPPISFSNNAGFALQAGVDIPVGDGPYFVNFDAKKLFLSTTMKAAGGTIRASADLNPWIVGAGVGIRF